MYYAFGETDVYVIAELPTPETAAAVGPTVEICQLTLAVVVINSWSRLVIAFRALVGEYVFRVNATSPTP